MLPIAIIPQSALDVLEDVLRFWHDLIGGGANSWGWAIILLTFTIRLLILPLTFKSVKSMQSSRFSSLRSRRSRRATRKTVSA